MKNKKILIVDDDPDILEPVALLLEEEGYTVSTSTKGDQTCKKVAQFTPDVILLDTLMSGHDGRKICKTLKKQSDTKYIPIIMMSAYPAAERDAMNVGADDFIAKPFETELLLTLVAKHST